MMKAVVVVPSASGPTLELRSVREPQAGPQDLTVAVKAAGLNRADLARAQQHYASTDVDIAGLELAGEVIAVGAAVAGWRVGDRVMAMARDAYAERAVVDARFALRVPENVGWTEAAAMPTWFLTAHDAIVTNGRLAKGESCLITAVASGVGIAALQVAKAMGAGIVLGTSSSPSKLARLKSDFGLDAGLDGAAPDFAEQVKAATGNRGADVTIDHVGASMIAGMTAAAALKGRIVSVGRLGGKIGPIDLDLVALKRLHLVGVTFRTRTIEEKQALARAFEADLWDALVNGRLRPLVAATYPLDAALAAQEAMRTNAHLGKIVLVV